MHKGTEFLCNFVAMKRCLFLIALVIASCQTLLAAVEWLSTTHDFGVFAEDSGTVEHVFRFVNSGSEPVSILGTRSTCGCTTSRYGREALETGDTADITVSYNPAGRPGRFTKNVTVNLSDGSRCKLFVKGSVIGSENTIAQRFPVDLGGGLRCSRGVLMFGQLAKGQRRMVSLDLYNMSDEPLEPQACAPEHILVSFEPEVIAAGEEGSLMATFDARKVDYGLRNDTVLFKTASVEEPVALPTVAIVGEDFSQLSEEEIDHAPVVRLEELNINFGTIRRDKGCVTKTLSLKNTGERTLLVRSIYSADAGVTLAVSSAEIENGAEAEIRATINLDAIEGDILNARAMLITNAPASPNVAIRLVGLLE